MSCKSGIYAINNTIGTALADGATYAPTTVVRRYGQCLNANSNGITLNGIGYYDVSAAATVTATAVGSITAGLYKNGVLVPGATATATASAVGAEVVLPISAIVRTRCCVDNNAVLTVQISGQATTAYNLTINVEKE